MLVIGDENLLFTAGIQEAYPHYEFTCATVLSTQNLQLYNFDTQPVSLRGRIRPMVDPCRVSKHFRPGEFDSIMLFLPGLSFMVPPELGTADRPLFAYRTHLFVFHVMRHAKMVLKGEGQLHLVWPDETSLMTSPCGAAGIEMPQLMRLCGCKSLETPTFEYSKIEDGWFMPFIFGEVPQTTPEWLASLHIHPYAIDKSPIAVPLSVALLLHPDTAGVTIKDASPMPSNMPQTPNPPLRQQLIHEATARKDRLKAIYGPRETMGAIADAYGLVQEPPDEDSMLSVPMEIFMISFDEIAHISLLLRYQVCDDQPQLSVATLDVLDPRLPTRIARPPPPKSSPAFAGGAGGKKRKLEEEWGGMKYMCPLTKICTMTPSSMRQHLNGDLYKRMAASTPGWEDSQEKKTMLEILDEAEHAEKAPPGTQQRQAEQRTKQRGNKGKGGGK